MEIIPNRREHLCMNKERENPEITQDEMGKTVKYLVGFRLPPATETFPSYSLNCQHQINFQDCNQNQTVARVINYLYETINCIN
jgi:hypothetical protein